MNRMQLICHPATPSPRVNSLVVALSLTGKGGLEIQFDCACAAGALFIPDARPAQAADELWRHTCCEVFVGEAGDAAYREYNFSPSGQWAMYGFSAYRLRDPAGLNPSAPAPRIRFASHAEGWTLQAQVDASAFPVAAGASLELGVAAVLEAAGGGLSYWALRHAAAQPDFHRRESFVQRLGGLA